MEVVKGPDINQESKLIYLMEQYGEALLRMCHVYLRDSTLAEDAVQDTFVKAFKALDSVRGDCSEKAWLMRIAINTCKDIRRSAWYRYVDRRVTLEYVPTPSYMPTMEQSELVVEIMKLPKKYMEVVLLYYYQGLTTIEIGDALNIPNQTVSSRLRRAREKLRLTLEGGYCNEKKSVSTSKHSAGY